MAQDDNDGMQGREGALAALREVAREADLIRQFGAAANAFEAADYEQLIMLAWRHQFDEDRGQFKRDLRELQQHVSQRILDSLELAE